MHKFTLLMVAAIAVSLTPMAVSAQAAPSAAIRLNELGPENQAMASREGLWDVVETYWASPDASPVSTTGLVAERKMIGLTLQEFLHPAEDGSASQIKRLDYLTFNRVEGRWDYVSMDSRVPAGLMSAWSFGRDQDDKIELRFQPFAIAGSGQDASGQMLQMRQVISHKGPDQDVKDQYFIAADGTGTQWLAHRYAYKRRLGR